jgi:hypothetical protein
MLACALTIAIAPFTAHADPDKNESGKGEGKDGYEAKNRDDVAGRDWDSYDDWVRDRSRRDRSSPYFRDRYSRLDIPYGHYPPPGECRLISEPAARTAATSGASRRVADSPPARCC